MIIGNRLGMLDPSLCLLFLDIVGEVGERLRMSE
jgi:hypothetical protein